MAVTIASIQELRNKTNAGYMDCKEALKESNGDLEKAVIYLRKKGLAEIGERGHKNALEGIIGYYVHPGSKLAVLVEVNSETDFVAKNEEFKQFVKDLAMHIAATNPSWIMRQNVPEDIILREKSIIVDSIKDKPPQIIEKIVSGKLDKFFKETCLMEQAFVKNENLTITDMLGSLAAKIGEKIVVKRFSRFVVGEQK